MIEVKQLGKLYGDRWAVKDVSFKMASGRIYGLLGENGAGKSTTMNMMTGCLRPTQGCVRINGFDVVLQPLEAKRQIGYLPEQPPLYGDMTPREYLRFIARAKGVLPARIEGQVERVLELTDTTELGDRLIKHLSKGCCQRVGLAQALLGDPRVVILDEPTVGLDPKQIVAMRTLIRTLAKEEGRTVIISSHILSEIGELCDELLVISDGQLIASGTPEALSSSLGREDKLLLSVRGDAAGVTEVLGTVDGVTEVALTDTDGDVARLSVSVESGRDVRDAVFFAMAEKKYAVLQMERQEQTLEKLFLALTQTDKAQPESGEQLPESADKEETV